MLLEVTLYQFHTIVCTEINIRDYQSLEDTLKTNNHRF